MPKHSTQNTRSLNRVWYPSLGGDSTGLVQQPCVVACKEGCSRSSDARLMRRPRVRAGAVLSSHEAWQLGVQVACSREGARGHSQWGCRSGLTTGRAAEQSGPGSASRCGRPEPLAQQGKHGRAEVAGVHAPHRKLMHVGTGVWARCYLKAQDEIRRPGVRVPDAPSCQGMVASVCVFIQK